MAVHTLCQHVWQVCAADGIVSWALLHLGWACLPPYGGSLEAVELKVAPRLVLALVALLALMECALK